MSEVPKQAEFEVPVVCGLCGTRMYATRRQIGTALRCPDCFSETIVRPPPAKPKRPPLPSGDDYQLADDAPGSSRPSPEEAAQYVKVVCVTCHGLMRSRQQHAGKKVRCPECDTVNIVPSIAIKPQFQLPDVTDVKLDSPPPPPVDEKKKYLAEQLMAKARQEVEQKEQEKPKLVTKPWQESVYEFPFSLKVLPLWVAMSATIIICGLMINMINELSREISRETMFAVFISIVLSFVTLCVSAVVAPHLLWIVRFTAEGHWSAPHWPSSDLFDRLYSIALLFTAFALSVAPAAFVGSALHLVGLPSWIAIPVALIPFPILLLSMLDADSLFTPLTRHVYATLSEHRGTWVRFYQITLSIAAAMVVLLAGAVYLRPVEGSVLAAIIVPWYLLVYFRLLGRLASQL